jgi:hypothetical protein
VNIVMWFWTRTFIKNRYGSEYPTRAKVMLLCSGLYVFGCAFRSFIPRADVQRFTLFDSWFASVFVGRTVATIAELAFVLQWAMVLSFVSKTTGSALALTISKMIVPLIAIAEICSWYAVISTNYMGNAIEESLWTATYLLIGLSLVLLVPKLRGALKYAVGIAVVVCGIYVCFMAMVDVPMYLSRHATDVASGKQYFGFGDGMVDLNSRWIVTHKISDWKSEIPWMSLYFSFAVWVSIALCYVPLSLSHSDRNTKR